MNRAPCAGRPGHERCGTMSAGNLAAAQARLETLAYYGAGAVQQWHSPATAAYTDERDGWRNLRRLADALRGWHYTEPAPLSTVDTDPDTRRSLRAGPTSADALLTHPAEPVQPHDLAGLTTEEVA